MHDRRRGSAAFSTLAIAALSLALTTGCTPKEDAPSGLTYSANPAVYTKGLAVTANVPTYGGGTPDSFSASPPLPAGLSLDRSTGIISGTPSAVATTATYTVTAKNEGGSTTASLTLTVDARLAVLFTTDEHSHVFAAAPELDDFPMPTTAGSGSLKGGVARRATVLSTERAGGAMRGVETITVSAGDVDQGTLAAVLFTTLNPDLAFTKLLGYDAIAVGNHDFDLGLTALYGALSVASAPPLVLTNVTFDPVSTADDLIASIYGDKGSGKTITGARVITTAGGTKVGVVAALGRGAASSSALAKPISFTGGVDPLDPTQATAALDAIAAQLQPAIDALRTDDAVDAVVLLGHGGIGATSTARGDDELLAAKLKGVDLVVSGHTHLKPDAVRYVLDPDGRQVPIMQAAPFGSEVGRAELVIHGTGRPELDTDPARTRFIAVDDRIVPSQDFALLVELATVVGALEMGTTPSFLESNLSAITGATVTDDPAVLGDLYHYVLGKTTYDLIGLGSGETNGSDLDTDAMLAAADAIVTTSDPKIALQNRGAIRGDLLKGKSGELGFADVYRVVPNGGDPVEASPGYPLVHVYISVLEVIGALDTTAKKAVEDGDFFLVPGGLKYEYDSSRPLTPTGSWIKRVARIDGSGTETQVLYDDTLVPPLRVPTTTLIPTVATLYTASFAQFAGVNLRDSAGTVIADPTTAILTRAGGSHVKDYQALATYVFDQCAANGGNLPSRYDGVVPRRVLCGPTGSPACQQ